jgi:hypothetical protein
MPLQVVKKKWATYTLPATSFSVTRFPSWFVKEKGSTVLNGGKDFLPKPGIMTDIAV